MLKYDFNVNLGIIRINTDWYIFIELILIF